jgi:hypothetical protein
MAKEINVVELAAEISAEWLQDVATLNGVYPYVTAENGDVVYTEQAQDWFNEIYDTVTGIVEEHVK